ncbi:protein-tyrosine phosphatase [Metarhizium rileyi]|uniref:Protein-tyrosine phosphatase n=1 Tax=Metarhizium rileyi (strain RCEF 4871) TaxID=1649241 RepID=A0A162K1D3_METRR|nr:protein-tyrosine phosphatase [Metarhizium rileyi RCEF 4871]
MALLGLASARALVPEDHASNGDKEPDDPTGGLCRFEIISDHTDPGDLLARSSAPYYFGTDGTQIVTPATVRCIRERGITHVISLNSQALRADIRFTLANAGIAYTPIPVQDYHEPTQADFRRGWEAFRQHRRGTLVWCGFGHGRTGTMITALQMYLQHERGRVGHWNDNLYRANHVETPSQRRSLDELEASLRSREQRLRFWGQDVFGELSCAAAVAAMSISINKFGRSLSEPKRSAADEIELCRRARKTAGKGLDRNTPPCNKLKKLRVGFQLSNNNWAGTYDLISVAFASETDTIKGQHERVTVADMPPAGLHVWKDVDMKKIFGSPHVAMRDLRYVGIYDYSAGLGVAGDRWELQGLTLRGMCVNGSQQVEVDKYASIDKYLQHSDGNKGNPWMFQIPFFPPVSPGHKGTAELVWVGNITAKDWKVTGAEDNKSQDTKATASSPDVCFSEGTSQECNEVSGKLEHD